MKSKNSRKSSEKWPKRVRAEGSRVEIPVYRRQRANGGVGFRVANPSNGQRRLESFEEEVDAIERAEDLSRLLGNRKNEVASLTNQEVSVFQACVKILEPSAIPIVSACEIVAECYKLVGSLSEILKASEAWAKNHPSYLKPRMVPDAVEELILEKEKGGASERYVEDLKYRLRQFAGKFQCNVGTVMGPDVQTWLEGKNLAPQSWKNFMTVLSVFSAFCQRKGYLPKSWDELERVASPKVKRLGDVTVYRVDEWMRLLAGADESFLPALTLQGFCGLRSAEVERLQWDAVNLKEKTVTVGSQVAKTNSRRICPLPDSAIEWLRPLAKSSGPVWSGKRFELYNTQRDLARQCGFQWRHNGLRHSAISAKLALTGDVSRVAFESGNSPKVVHSHYKSLMSAKDAKKWMGVKPPKSAKNIIKLATKKVA